MPTVFKGTGATVSSSTPQDVWTGTTGAQTIIASIGLANTVATENAVRLYHFNSTNGAKLLGSWTLGGIDSGSGNAQITQVMLNAGDKIQVASASSLAVDVVVSVSETT